MHGGRLRVQSQLGKGSTFTVALPLLSGTSSSAAPPDLSDAPVSEPVALVVDDDPAASELIADNLRAAGLSVIVARNVDEALRLALARIIVCVTLDVVLPGGDGWSLLEQLKRRPETAKIPVLVVSVVDEIQRGALLGASACLLKPVSFDELTRALASAGVSLCLLQGVRVVIVKKGGDRDEIEEHLGRAGCHVRRAEAVAGAAALADFDVALIDGADEVETGRAATALATAFPGVPVLALVDPSARLSGPLPVNVKPLFRGDALRLDRLVRAVAAARERGRERGDGPLRAPPRSEILS
jgi:CheY-like chemotaxis protein